MKIIRPEYTPPKKVEEIKPVVEEISVTEKEELSPLEQIMQESMCEELTNPNYVKVTITLTKKQAELFDKKGGVNWLKKALVGQKYKKGK